MAIVSQAAANINRSASYIDISQDWTIYQKVYYPDTAIKTLFEFSDLAAFVPPGSGLGAYSYIESAGPLTGQFIQDLEIYDTTGAFFDYIEAVVSVTTWTNIAFRYKRSTTTLDILINGVVQDSIVVDLATKINPVLFESVIGALAVNTGGLSCSYKRVWQAWKTTTELIAEQTSITAVSLTNLLAENPLQAGIDLTDHSGNGRQFFPSGTITTDFNDPLLSTIAGPPTNTTPATALDITLSSALFIDTLSAGVAAPETWYKYTVQASDRWYGSQGFGNLGTFSPVLRIYDGLANANSLTPYRNISPAANGAAQFIAPATGNVLYFGLFRNAAVTPATAIVSLLKGPNLTVPVGAIAISDDISNEYAAVFASTIDDNVVYNFAELVGGEQADVLPASGYSFIADQIDGTGNIIYNTFFAETTNVSTLDSTKARIRTCNTPGRWYHSVNTNPPTVRTVDQDGTIGPLITLTGSTSIAAHAASNDETKLYFAQTGNNATIKTWDLVNNIAGTNLVTGVANYTVTDILYLGNDKIAVMLYKNTVTRDANLRIYNTSGTLLVNVSLGTPVSTGPRICYAINDPISIYAYIHLSNEQSTLMNVASFDGSITSSKTVPTFESAAGVTPTTNTPSRFGASFSCPIWVVRVASLIPISTASGLYKLTGTNINNPRVTHDTVWVDASLGTTESRAIPNPFAESYLAGDE